MSEATANKVCPKCSGTGKFITTGSTECPMCKGVGFIDVLPDQMQGRWHNYPPDHAWQTTARVNGFPEGYGYDNKKTLLDEFAMAAIAGTCANSEYEKLRQALDCMFSEEKQTSALVSVCYDYAAAMMRERNRRDEMGNVKEAAE